MRSVAATRRTPLLAGIVLAVVLLAPSSAPGASSGSDDLVKAMRAARGARVERLVTERAPATDSTTSASETPRLRSVAAASVDSKWARQFADALLVKSRFIPNGRCGVVWRTDVPQTEQILARVTLDTWRGAVTADLRFHERCAELADSLIGGVIGTFEIDATAANILALLKRALPDDSTLRQATAPPGFGRSAHDWRKRDRDGATQGAPVPGPGDSVRVDVLPEKIRGEAPRYPNAARRAEIEGTVLLQALIGRDGLVKDTRVARSIPELDAAAADAVRAWRFKPASYHGDPVAVWVVVPVKFTLR